MVNRGDFFPFLSSTSKANDLECKEPAKPRHSSIAGSEGGWLPKYFSNTALCPLRA